MADYLYLNETGTIVPDTTNILVEVQDEYKAALGADLVVTPDTPQGVLITAETLSRDEVVNNNAALANQLNPNISGGIFLDAQLAFLGLQRIAATRTLVPNVVLTGVAATSIPAGTQAQNEAGIVFESVNTVILDGGGAATVDFQAVDYGPIVCATNTLNQIVTNILGWETVNNPDAAVLGANTMSDQAARAYRNNSLAFQAVSLAEAITSALYNVEGVTSLTFQENVAATTQTINTISMVAHSVWACVQGGSDLDVAAALLENKSSGAAWNGGTTVNVVEPASGQTYAVKFDRPTEIGILIKVTSPNGNLPAIQAAVLAYAAGLVDGLTGFVVGADISAFEIAAAIIAQLPATYINKLEISYESPISYTTSELAIAINEIAVTEASFITMVAP